MQGDVGEKILFDESEKGVVLQAVSELLRLVLVTHRFLVELRTGVVRDAQTQHQMLLIVVVEHDVQVFSERYSNKQHTF